MVSLSSCEAEYYATCETSKSILFVKNFLLEMAQHNIISFDGFRAIPLFIDNRATKDYISNGKPSKKLRHIDLRHMFVKDLVRTSILAVFYVSTDANLADPNTKILAANKHQHDAPRLLGMIKVVHPPFHQLTRVGWAHYLFSLNVRY
jgi:hypothetical protein